MVIPHNSRRTIAVAAVIGCLQPGISVILAWNIQTAPILSEIAFLLYAVHFLSVLFVCTSLGLVDSFKVGSWHEILIVLLAATIFFGVLYSFAVWAFYKFNE